jgi:hypothetical protein
MAIHQPSAKMFDAFDHVLLLADGRTCFYGSPRGLGPYLRAAGFAPTDGDDTPAADYALELLHQPAKKEKLIELWDSSSSVAETYTYLSQQQQQPQAQHGPGHGPEDAPENGYGRWGGAHGRSTHGEEKVDEKADVAALDAPSLAHQGYAASWWTQFRGLYVRAFRSTKYGRFTPLKLSETAVIALVTGACWFQMQSTEKRIVDMTGYFFFSSAFIFFFNMFLAFNEFFMERACLKKEREAGLYHLSAYFLAKTVASAPVRMALPAMYILISYPMVMAQVDGRAFAAIVFIIVLVALVAESVGLLISTVTVDYEMTLSVGTLTALGMMLLGGFYVKSLPPWLAWLKWTSSMRYAYSSLVQVQFVVGPPLLCEGGEVIPACRALPSGTPLPASDVLAWIGIDAVPGTAITPTNVFMNVGMLAGLFIAIRFASYLTLRFVRINPGRR